MLAKTTPEKKSDGIIRCIYAVLKIIFFYEKGVGRGELSPGVKSGTIDLSELLASAGNMKKSRVGFV